MHVVQVNGFCTYVQDSVPLVRTAPWDLRIMGSGLYIWCKFKFFKGQTYLYLISLLCFGIFNLCFGPRATASFSSLSVFNPAVPFDDLPCP